MFDKALKRKHKLEGRTFSLQLPALRGILCRVRGQEPSGEDRRGRGEVGEGDKIIHAGDPSGMALNIDN